MSGWTQERVQQLEELWAEGLSCSQIGQQLGITRNAVIGKVSRLRYAGKGFMARDAAAARVNKTNESFVRALHAERVKAMVKTKRKTAKPAVGAGQGGGKPPINEPGEPKIAEPAGEPVLFKDLLPRDDRSARHNRCLWRINPVWEREVWCCGAQTRPGGVFCEHHTALATGKQPQGRTKPAGRAG